MKKFFALLTCLLLLTVLAACGKTETPSSSATSESVVAGVTPDYPSGPDNTDGVPHFLTAEQQQTYKVAQTAYAQFMMNTDGFGSTGSETVVVDGVAYMVGDGAYKTYAEFETAMLQLFTPELLEELNNSRGDGTTIFAEGPNGELAFQMGGRGSRIDYVGCTFEERAGDDNSLAFVMLAEYADLDDASASHTYEEYNFKMENMDGNWVFSEFNLPY